jgi:hypothetical protein
MVRGGGTSQPETCPYVAEGRRFVVSPLTRSASAAAAVPWCRLQPTHPAFVLALHGRSPSICQGSNALSSLFL